MCRVLKISGFSYVNINFIRKNSSALNSYEKLVSPLSLRLQFRNDENLCLFLKNHFTEISFSTHSKPTGNVNMGGRATTTDDFHVDFLLEMLSLNDVESERRLACEALLKNS